MPRSVNHVASKARRTRILKLTKGYFGAIKKCGMEYRLRSHKQKRHLIK